MHGSKAEKVATPTCHPLLPTFSSMFYTHCLQCAPHPPIFLSLLSAEGFFKWSPINLPSSAHISLQAPALSCVQIGALRFKRFPPRCEFLADNPWTASGSSLLRWNEGGQGKEAADSVQNLPSGLYPPNQTSPPSAPPRSWLHRSSTQGLAWRHLSLGKPATLEQEKGHHHLSANNAEQRSSQPLPPAVWLRKTGEGGEGRGAG